MREFLRGAAFFVALLGLLVLLTACAFYEIGPCLFMLGVG